VATEGDGEEDAEEATAEAGEEVLAEAGTNNHHQQQVNPLTHRHIRQ